MATRYVRRSMSEYATVVVSDRDRHAVDARLIFTRPPPKEVNQPALSAYVDLIVRLPGDAADGSMVDFGHSDFLYTHDEEG